jgi:phosphonate transport system substrate-binding protein
MKFLIALFLSLQLSWAASVQAAEKVYTFGVVPQSSTAEMVETWLPFVDWLSKKSGVPIRFVTAPDIPAFEKKLEQGAYDVAFMNPYLYTVYHKKYGYEAFVKEKGRKLTGVLVVRNDSPIKSIKELEGATLVFPAPASFAASILPRAALRKQGISFKTKFVSSHDSVYLNVVSGHYPAGGGIMRVLDMEDEAVRKELRVLWTTPSYTPHPIVSNPKLPKEIVKKLQEAMVGMEDDPVGQQMLKLIAFKGIEAARDADWDDIRQLKISELDTRAD